MRKDNKSRIVLIRRLLPAFMFLCAVFLFAPRPAQAACTSPPADAGGLEWFPGTSQYKLCDGTTWNVIELDTTSLGACSPGANREWDATTKAFKVCDATAAYKKINCKSQAGGTPSYCSITLTNKITAIDGVDGDAFSSGIAVDGDTLAISASRADGLMGVVYIYTRSAAGVWTQQQKITASDRAVPDLFGSVALSGDTLLVACSCDIGGNVDQGAFYVFTRSAGVWTQQQKLVAPDGAAGDLMRYVSLDAMAAAIAGSAGPRLTGTGATNTSIGTIDWVNPGNIAVAGDAAYAQSNTTSSSQQTYYLTATNFGFAIPANATITGIQVSVRRQCSATAGGNACIANSIKMIKGGAIGGTDNAAQDAAWTTSFAVSNFGSTSDLWALNWTPADINASTFGVAISTKGTGSTARNSRISEVNITVSYTTPGAITLTAVIGAYKADNGATLDTGAAYVWTSTGGAAFTYQAKLVASDAATGNQFGADTSVSGNTAVIASNINNAAYVFTRSGSTWTQQQKLTGTGVVSISGFGYSVAVSGNTALIGCLFCYDTLTYEGKGFVFTRSGSTWTQQAILTPSKPEAYDWCGREVALEGDIAILDCPSGDSRDVDTRGAAYAFHRIGTAWHEVKRLDSADTQSLDMFGLALAIDNHTAFAGLAFNDTGATGPGPTLQGAVYSFRIPTYLASSNGSLDNFGYTVDIYGDTAVVGAYFDDIGANTDQGSAYVYTRAADGQWSLQQQLLASDGAASNRYGSSVAIYGDTVAVGAVAAGAGTVYVYTRSGSTWTEQQKLVGADGLAGEWEGFSVDIYADTIVAGSFNDPDSGLGNVSSVYVFTRSGTTWTQQQKLLPSVLQDIGRFGYDVTIYGDTIAVGELNKTVGSNSGQGDVYVYTRSGTTWTQQAILTASDGIASQWFGGSVDLYGDTLVVGTIKDAAYVFTRSGTTWTQQQKLVGFDTLTNDWFGISAAIYGDTIVISASRDSEGIYPVQGSIYMFTRSGTIWTGQGKLTAGSPNTSDQFGGSGSTSGNGNGQGVAVYGTTVITGAWLDDVGANADQGSAYIFGTIPASYYKCAYSEQTLKGTAQLKASQASWTALSNVSLATGEALLLCIGTKGDTVTGVTWNGAALTPDVANTASATAKSYIYSLPNATAGTGNIVVSLGTLSTSGKALTAMSVKGLLASSMLDKTAAGTGTGTTPTSGSTAATAQANELQYNCVGTNGPLNQAAGSWVLASDTQRMGSSGGSPSTNFTASEGTREVTGTGTYSAAKTAIASADWAASVATYKENVSSGGCIDYGACSTVGQMNYDATNGMLWCDGTNWRAMKAP
jgi:hypothetical protein